jgi:hypothetical protein
MTLRISGKLQVCPGRGRPGVRCDHRRLTHIPLCSWAASHKVAAAPIRAAPGVDRCDARFRPRSLPRSQRSGGGFLQPAPQRSPAKASVTTILPGPSIIHSPAKGHSAVALLDEEQAPTHGEVRDGNQDWSLRERSSQRRSLNPDLSSRGRGCKAASPRHS